MTHVDQHSHGRAGRDTRELERGDGGSATSSGFAGYDEVGDAGGHHTTQDPHYRRWRQEQLRGLDADYADWRRERYRRFCEDIARWRDERAGSGTSPGTR
jgi:hypothetical protein